MLCRLPFLWIGFRRELAEFGFNAPCGFLRSKLVAHRPIGATPLSDVGNVTQHDPNSVVPTRWLVFVIPILWRQSTPSTRLTMWFAVRTDVRRLLARSEQYPDILIPSTWRMNGLWCRDDILFYISFVLILFSSFSIFFLLLAWPISENINQWLTSVAICDRNSKFTGFWYVGSFHTWWWLLLQDLGQFRMQKWMNVIG